MGNNNIKTTNDILIKIDHNNLIYIDPNSVLNNGIVEPRGTQPEDLMMYVNLEADLIPRTTLIAGDKKNTLTSIARGSINFLRNQNGQDYDTTWTDTFTDRKMNYKGDVPVYAGSMIINTPLVDGVSQDDSSSQSFGIQDISIKVMGANFIPRVDIKFIDVRGKTLFESPKNSPYSAFFHIPWPIFYLTVKGYYGKAIRYRLHLIKFNSKFNSSNGNFEIDCNFVGSTYAYLADISLESILNAPYFYLTQVNEPVKYNEKTGMNEQKISKTTKGYRVLRSVYQEYISKGFLPVNFPVRTLREIIVLAGRLNKILERKIYKEIISYHTLAGVKEYEDLLVNFVSELNAWSIKFMSEGTTFTIPGEERNGEPIKWYTMSSSYKNSNKEPKDVFNRLINTYVEKLNSNMAFGENKSTKSEDHEQIKLTSISCSGLADPTKFYRNYQGVDGFDRDGVKYEISLLNVNYRGQRSKLEDDIEKVMNEFIEKDPDLGLGFTPTVRNIVAILLANAETYIRLMKDVHEKAFEKAAERKKLFDEQSISSNAITTDGGNAIYPWPEVKVAKLGDKENVLVYPGDSVVSEKLQSYDRNLWPEVDFIENFYEIATKVKDNLLRQEGDSEGIHLVYGDTPETYKRDISTLTNQLNNLPYTNKSASSILYELYERAKYTTSMNPFDVNSTQELANIEYLNLKDQVSYDVDIVDILKRNITSYDALLYQMEASLTKYQYYVDQLPTTSYIQTGINNDFKIEKYNPLADKTKGNNEDYTNLTTFLNDYRAEDYRVNTYPFNSSTYKSYLPNNNFNLGSLNITGMLKVDTPNEFISSPNNSDMWIKDGYQTNLFTNKIKIGNEYKHILNTPYFHKQLYDDFVKIQSSEKYVGSAYLLLNSLPYKDLDDTVSYEGKEVLMSSMFREIGATHFLPYHLMLKWGSMYHRYKKYINENVDIIANITDPIDGSVFFDNGNNLTFNTISDVNTGGVKTVNRNNETDIGIHPYYETIFYQITNGFGFMNTDSQVTSYSEKIADGTIKTHYDPAIDANSWTSFIDNSKFTSTDTRYSLLPTNGYNHTIGTGFELAEQENFRILWNVGTDYTPGANFIDYSDYDFPTYNQKFKDIENNEYTLASNNRKIVDLIATFKPEILDTFESAFLDFASEKLNEVVPYKPYDTSYTKFQDLLNEITSIQKNDNDSVDDDFTLYPKIKERQTTKLADITSAIKSQKNLIRLVYSNPREINDYVFGGFTGVGVAHFSPGTFNEVQFTPDNLKKMELYLGEDMDGYYRDFFSTNDIEVNEENIKQFRPLIYYYAGLRSNGEQPTKSEFSQKIKDNILDFSANNNNVKGSSGRLEDFLDQLITNIQSDLKPLIEEKQISPITRGWNDDKTVKLELYNYFKSFNDKWTAGNSIGQRSLIEEFLFLDRANKDIGDKVYINLEKVLRMGLMENAKINLYGAISLLVQDTGFDIRALPAYVNFYGTTPYSSGKPRIIPSKDVAKTMFGSFLEVDYQESTPKIILQYMGPSSKHPDMSEISKKVYLFNDDGTDISQPNGCPLVIANDVFSSTDFSKSNRVVAFEVSFGDQNQSIFKTVELDQSTIRNTSESFYVLENLGRSEGGASTAQVDIGLWQIYRQASYQCQVTCMGNVMIQPTMYFNLKNVPLFKGTYWITEVTHNIKPTGIETVFKGSRIPNRALPDPENSFMTSYRPLFDKVVETAIKLVKDESKQTQEVKDSKNEKVSVKDSGTYVHDNSIPPANKDEKWLDEHNITPYGIPYNGYDDEKYIQLIEYKGEKWLRAQAVEIGTYDYRLSPNRSMGIISKTTLAPDIKFSDIVEDKDYYITRFRYSEMPRDLTTLLFTEYDQTEFLYPSKTGDKRYTVNHTFNHGTKIYNGPIDTATDTDLKKYGIALSTSIMKNLGIYDGDIVYFRLVNK